MTSFIDRLCFLSVLLVHQKLEMVFMVSVIIIRKSPSYSV